MQITNVSKSRLVLATGDVIEAGGVIDAPSFDDKHSVMKAWLDAGLISIASTTDDQSKPLSKMKVNELQNYIADNGGDFDNDDQKSDLLMIAQGIEDKLNDSQ